MLKFKLFIILFLTIQLSFSQHNEQSKELENSFTAAIGLPYSFHLKSLGINTRLYYNIGEHICFGPEVSFFKKNETSILELNFVGHYIFEIKHIGVYPLLGINYTIEKESFFKEEELGLVVGVGAHKNFNKIMLFVEYSHIESHLKDDFATIGLMYHF